MSGRNSLHYCYDVSLPLLRNVVLWLKRTSTKSLQTELVTKYDINDAQKESLVGESKPAKGGSISVSGCGLGGGPNPRRLQIHCDTSAKCPWFLVMTSVSFRSSVSHVGWGGQFGLISRGNLVKWLIWRERQDNGRANCCHQQWPLCMLLRGAIVNNVFFFPSLVGLICGGRPVHWYAADSVGCGHHLVHQVLLLWESQYLATHLIGSGARIFWQQNRAEFHLFCKCLFESLILIFFS